MNKYEMRTQATKNDLCEAFMELYREKEINRITVGDITARAGYNRGTFYRHYLDIYDLFDAVKTFF